MTKKIRTQPFGKPYELSKRLIVDRSGNFGGITVMLAVPLVATAGLALDVTNALLVRTELYNAADAAAIGAVADSSPAVAAAMAMSGDGTVTVGQDDARKLFFGQASADLRNIPVNIDIAVTKAANMVTSKVTFNATVPTTLLQILGKTWIRHRAVSDCKFHRFLHASRQFAFHGRRSDVDRHNDHAKQYER